MYVWQALIVADLTPEAYFAMARLCPNLENLRLHLCGRLSTEVVASWPSSLTQLTRVELYGPFLVRKEGWIPFFKAIGKRLEAFLVTQSPRIDLETVETMVDSCPNITELRLAEIGLLNDDLLRPLGRLINLRLLDLSSPSLPLNDEAMVQLLSDVGANLTSLNLSDIPDLTDVTLVAIAKYCPKLRQLQLRNLVELTDEGVSVFFAALKKTGHPGFEAIDMEKGHDLRSGALEALLAHSGPTVEKLSLLGWREVEATALNGLTKCNQLRELDVGWCRQVTDWSIKDVLDSCDSIKLIKVWGTLHLPSIR